MANTNPQLSLGDKLSVFSDKAYRKNNGKYFEAVGNVVIISQKDTIYAELASLDQESMTVKIEGNVRFITKDMTLYGSHVDYNITTGQAHIKNARILTTNFNLMANELVRINETQYIAREAEFTTCKDCTESWAIYGKTIKVDLGKYIQVSHGLFKIKGVDVIYVPYLIFPILSKRESGLLVPRISSRSGEGLSYEQPIFWAIDEHKDATFSPTFWADRGYGGDLQFRQRFSQMSWLEVNNRSINDTIYLPGENNNKKSGEEYFRHFTEIEGHQFWSPNVNSHFRYTWSRDLDFIRDNPLFSDPKVNSSDYGFQGILNWRQEKFSLNVEADYLRNQLFDDATEFDRSYVQTLPRISLGTVPHTLYQSETPFLQHIAIGADASYTRFRQVKKEETDFLRNTDRFSAQPYLMWHFLTLGPVNFKSTYTFDQQSYYFQESKESGFGKNAGLLKTEVSFTIDKIFGLAYEERIPLKYISNKDQEKIQDSLDQSLSPIQREAKPSRLVGKLKDYDSVLAKDSLVQTRNSFRHSQEYKFIYHYITSENEYGNKRFLDQIKSSQFGQFDYEDTLRSEEHLFGANTRTLIPPDNTFELQWNNTLIKKTPKNFNYLEDDRYLRDNFSYTKIGWFNISQGYLLDQRKAKDIREKLTRLMVDTGYYGERWHLGLQEYYFHLENENIFTLNFTRRFEYLNLFSSYNYNSFTTSTLNSLSFGGQIRPTDTIGVAMIKDIDLGAKKDMKTVYSLDLMPHNNCWIFNLNYRESIVDSRYSFNVIFNFGDEKFERYRTDYFSVKRL